MKRKVETRSAVVIGVGVLEVDLVLAGRDLVVGRLDLEAHLLEGEDDVPARFLAAVDGGQVEVGALVVRVDDRIAVGVAAEQEELGLGARDHRVAEGRGLVHLLLQGHRGDSPRNGVPSGLYTSQISRPTFSPFECAQG